MRLSIDNMVPKRKLDALMELLGDQFPDIPVPEEGILPDTARLITMAYTPFLAFGPLTVTPGALAVATTRFSPVVTTGPQIIPTTASLTLASFSPSVFATQGPRGLTFPFQDNVAPESDAGWSSVVNIKVEDGSTASMTFPSSFDTGMKTYRLGGVTYNFTIPGTATILGVKVDIKRRVSAGACKDFRVMLVYDYDFINSFYLTIGNNKADTSTSWPSTLTTVSYGGELDTWGAALTPAIVNGNYFGAYVSAEATADNTNPRVDFFQMTIYYI